MRNLSMAVAIAIMTLVSAAHAAAPPARFAVQGFVTDDSGMPLEDGAYSIRFALYNDPSSNMPAALLYEETLDVEVVQGLFSVQLGNTTPLDLAVFRDNSDVYLGLTVEDDVEATPRLALATVPYAANAMFAESAGDAETVGGAELSDLQSRVVGTCASGQFMRAIAADGTVTCADDEDTVVSQSTIEGYARGVAYDTPAELTAVLNASYAPVSHNHAAANITSGTLDPARYSALADLTAEGVLDNSAGTDLLTRAQADARYVAAPGPGLSCVQRFGTANNGTSGTSVTASYVACQAGEIVTGGGCTSGSSLRSSFYKGTCTGLCACLINSPCPPSEVAANPGWGCITSSTSDTAVRAHAMCCTLN